MYSGYKIFLSIVAGTLLTTVVANGQTTHHLLDSHGNPILTNRPGECVQTPRTSNTPAKLFVECNESDRDGDGIYDIEDVCPDNTPKEITKGVYPTGFEKGCPLDSDNDTVPDYRDDCPQNNALEISRGVNSRGCPLDTDQDTVPDYKDLCPDTPFGVAVDNDNGCEIIEEGSIEIVLAGDVTFAYDKTNLTSQAQTILNELVTRIHLKFTKNIEIVGHTDGVGSEQYNQVLSEQRAEQVANYMINQGIPTNKILHRGVGKLNPIASNKTKVGRAHNRRVEIKISRYKRKY